MRNTITIVVTIDRNYLQPAGVMLNSLLSNTRSTVHIWLLHPDLNDDDRALLAEVLVRHPHATIEYITVSNEPFIDLKITGHFSAVMYYKLCFDRILPASVDRLIYLDPDVIVTADIAELWRFDLGGALLAAVPVEVKHDRECIVKAGAAYFNCGIMLVNLKEWRDGDLSTSLMRVSRELASYYDRCPEMDVLNVVVRGRWLPLAPFWNYWPGLCSEGAPYSEADRERACRGNGILHFLGSIKPWQYAYRDPNQRLYLQYRHGTPWEKVDLQGKTAMAMLYRLAPRFFVRALQNKISGTAIAGIVRRWITS